MLLDAVILNPAQIFFDGEIFFDAELMNFALLTAIIEVPLFFLCGYRRFGDCFCFAVVNIVTNLLLNEFLELTGAEFYLQIIFPCEIVVMLLEFALCSYFIAENRKKLFYTLIFTNATSFLVGIAIF